MGEEQQSAGFPANRPVAGGLTRDWNIQRRFEGGYTGGRAQAVHGLDVQDNAASDGAVVASIRNEKLALFDLHSGQIRLILGSDNSKSDRLQGSTVIDETITAFAIHPSQPRAVTCSRNMMMRQWNLNNGECLGSWKLHHQKPVLAMDYDYTGTLVATGGSDSNVMVWDVEGGFPTHSFKGHAAIIHYVSFHPRSLLLTSADDDGKLRLWDLNKRSCIQELSEHYSAVTSVVWNQDDSRMFSAGRDKVINVWKVDDEWNLTLVKTFPIFESVECLMDLSKDTIQAAVSADTDISAKDRRFSKSTFYFLTAGDKGQIRLWKHKSGKDESIELAHGIDLRPSGTHAIKQNQVDKEESNLGTQFNELVMLKQSSGSPAIAAFSKGHSIEFFTLGAPSNQKAPCRLVHDKTVAGHLDDVIEARYLKKEETKPLLAIATNSEQWQLMNMDSLGTKSFGGHNDMILCLSVSPCGGYVATGSKDSTARLWSVNRSRCISILQGHTEPVGAVCFPYRTHTFSSAGSPFILTGSKDRTIKKWNLAPIFKKVESEELVDLQSVATIKAHEKDINAIAVSPNDRLGATASQDKSIKLWSTDTLNHVGTLKGHKRGVWSVQFSPVDRVLASASGDSTIRLWNVTEFNCLRTFQGHNAGVLQLTFLSGGLQIMSGGADGLVKLWNIHDSECINTWEAHDGKVWALDVKQIKSGSDSTKTNDQKEETFIGEMTTGGADGVIASWRDVTAEKVEEEIILKEKETEKQQELYNSMLMRKYNEAVQLCVELDQPDRLRDILAELLDIGPTESKLDKPNDINSVNLLGGKAQREWEKAMEYEFDALQKEEAGIHVDTESDKAFAGLGLGPKAGRGKIAQALYSLSPESLDQLFKWLRDWNTRARFSLVAQKVLMILLQSVSQSVLRKCTEFRPTIAAMIPYTARHLERLDRLLQSAYLLNYTVHGMTTMGGTADTEDKTEFTGGPGSVPLTLANQSAEAPTTSSDEEENTSDSEEEDLNVTENINNAENADRTVSDDHVHESKHIGYKTPAKSKGGNSIQGEKTEPKSLRSKKTERVGPSPPTTRKSRKRK